MDQNVKGLRPEPWGASNFGPSDFRPEMAAKGASF